MKKLKKYTIKRVFYILILSIVPLSIFSQVSPDPYAETPSELAKKELKTIIREK